MQFCTALVVLAAAVSVEAAASKSERLQWYFPFKYQTCTGCSAAGNLLPWCVKVPATNVICPIGSKAGSVSLPCVKVGVAAAATVAGTANALSAAAAAKLSIAGSQITCAKGAIDGSCIQLTAESFPADFVIPDTTTIGASQVTCSAANPISAACIGAISTGITVTGAQVTGAITTATISGAQVSSAVANANSSLTAGTAGTAAGLTCSSGSNVIPNCYSFNGTFTSTVSVPAGQVSGNLTAAAISPANICLPGQAPTAIGGCATIAGPRVIGDLTNAAISPSDICVTSEVGVPTLIGSCARVPGNQISTGTIPNTVTFDGDFGATGCTNILDCLASASVSDANSVCSYDGVATQSVFTSSCSSGFLYTGCPDAPPGALTCTAGWELSVTGGACTWTCADNADKCGTIDDLLNSCLG